MCKAMEDMRKEAALEARLEERKQFAIDLLAMGDLSYEQIAKLSRMTVEEVRALGVEYGTGNIQCPYGRKAETAV